MKLLLFISMLFGAVSWASIEEHTYTMISDKSCSDAITKAKKKMSSDYDVKSQLISDGHTIHNYEGYRLGECSSEVDHFFFQKTTNYKVPVYVKLKSSVNKVKILTISKHFIKANTKESDLFQNRFQRDLQIGELEKIALEKYPTLDCDEIDYITVKKGFYKRKLDGWINEIVVVIKK